MPAPDGHGGFRAIGAKAEPVHDMDRSRFATRFRRYRAGDGFEVLIPPELVERMLFVATRAAPNEAFALVVGRLCEDARGRYAVLSGIVPDAEAVATPVHVETTVHGERRMRALATLVFPEAIVLGWMHTHPGHGAAYSPTDRRTQATWTEPHSVGIVVDWNDPAQIAVYRGPKSELLRANDVIEARAHRQWRAVPPYRAFAVRPWHRRDRPKPQRSLLRVAVACALALGLLVGIALVGLKGWRRLLALEARVDAAERSVQACRPNDAPAPHVGPPRHDDTAPSHDPR